MSERKIYNSKIARSIIYFFTIGGLFGIISSAVYCFWNFILISSNIKPISILESLGIASLIYIFYFGIRFGLENNPVKMSHLKPPYRRESDNQSVLFSKKITDSLTEKQKENLIKSINKTVENTHFPNHNFN